MKLDLYQQRVLGALMEKETATPETYPLSLNALIAACNQRSSRDPVLDLDEEQVRQALHGLEAHGLTTPVRDARVPKFEHRARTVLNLRRDETAIVCLLLLRGPQTPGELRSRADRLHGFDDLAGVQSALERLASRVEGPDVAGRPSTKPLVMVLPRQPGSREARYIHLLGDLPSLQSPARSGATVLPDSSDAGDLRRELAEVRQELAVLKQRIEALEARA